MLGERALETQVWQNLTKCLGNGEFGQLQQNLSVKVPERGMGSFSSSLPLLSHSLCAWDWVGG